MLASRRYRPGLRQKDELDSVIDEHLNSDQLNSSIEEQIDEITEQDFEDKTVEKHVLKKATRKLISHIKKDTKIRSLVKQVLVGKDNESVVLNSHREKMTASEIKLEKMKQ